VKKFKDFDLEIFDFFVYAFLALLVIILVTWVMPEIARYAETESQLNDGSWEYHQEQENPMKIPKDIPLSKDPKKLKVIKRNGMYWAKIKRIVNKQENPK